ncbi:ACT domain-containing protein [Microbulbifer sp. OS29]|uniref:ACT domain-containing protein n=1 Tax=Microbulbifer okhotskensis TaxID=2926617 RepID=A0A9X2EJW1_9GAMM|nr:ACT domain-containing protein [Microbulbifer okhotskensis]MCO1333024.1 ACT domain-containing protein [Microbulbifer okhotskensis]
MKADVSQQKVVKTLYPRLHDEIYVFCQVSDTLLTEVLAESLCFFREGEGMSVILPQRSAQHFDMAASAPFRQITLQVPAGVNTVKLIPIIVHELTEAGIDINVVSALKFDHIFVPEDSAEFALKILRGVRSRFQYV